MVSCSPEAVVEAHRSFPVQVTLWGLIRPCSKEDFFTVVIVFLYLIIVHVVIAACLMKVMDVRFA